MVLKHLERLGFNQFLRVKGHTSVDESVLAALVVLEGLAANLLLTVNETILHTVVIEVHLAGVTIDLDNLFPVVVGFAVEMLNQFELVGETTTNCELVLTVRVVATDLLGNDAAVVLIQGDSLNETIDRFAL